MSAKKQTIGKIGKAKKSYTKNEEFQIDSIRIDGTEEKLSFTKNIPKFCLFIGFYFYHILFAAIAIGSSQSHFCMEKYLKTDVQYGYEIRSNFNLTILN